MKNIGFALLVFSILSFTSSSPINKDKVHRLFYATCKGYANCRACSNCKYCKHCNSGGSCGVCSSNAVYTQRNYLKPQNIIKRGISSQCQGITKKGNRCKRVVKGGGYCWQHSK
jgi:hypothetical protein